MRNPTEAEEQEVIRLFCARLHQDRERNIVVQADHCHHVGNTMTVATAVVTAIIVTAMDATAVYLEATVNVVVKVLKTVSFLHGRRLY